MMISQGMFTDPAMLLLSGGGLLTVVASVCMALDQFRKATGERGGGRDLRDAEASAAPRQPAFIFIGLVALPVMIGGFWGGGGRARWLAAAYWIGLTLAAGGALILLLRRY